MAREGVTVHRPERLKGDERTFLAPNGEGAQLFARDGMIVVGKHVIDASLRLKCRQRERYGLRPIIQQVVQPRGAHWSSVPLGSPGCVDGPFLEGGDTLLNGHEIYVGISGCASDLAGADWLQALLGDAYRVIPVAMKSNVLHLDCAHGADQARPAGLVPREADRRPADVAARLGQDRGLAGMKRTCWRPTASCSRKAASSSMPTMRRVIDELSRRKVDVIPLPFDGPISTGGGLRCAHHPLLRESVLA